MSVVDVLEKFNNKHTEVPVDDKAGWKRLLHGAMSKAAGLLWTAGGSVDVTLGPNIENSAPVFTEIRSSNDSYLSDDVYLSLDDSSSFSLAPTGDGLISPKTTSTPYIKKGVKSSIMDSASKSEKRSISKKNLTVKGDSGSVVNAEQFSLNLSGLCSELERLSLKKIISEVEKTITENIKDEFDSIREKMEDHNVKVDEELARDREEKEAERELTEMNWFQRVRESQLHIEQNLNSNLDVILARLKKNESNLKGGDKSNEIVAGEKCKDLEVVVKKSVLIESIGKTQKAYNVKYKDLLHLLESSRATLFTEFHNEFDALKRNNTLLTDIISKSKCGNITEDDVSQCEQLFISLSTVFDKIKLKNEEYENAKKIEEEANIKLKEALDKNRENSETTVKESHVKDSVEMDLVAKVDTVKEITSSDFSKRRTERLKYYKYISDTLKKAENSLEQFLNDDSYKNFRKDCQRAVNVPVNAISPSNSQHVQDKLDKLMDLLNGKNVPVMRGSFNAKTHPLGIKYCEILLARKIVKVGEDVVSSHPETGHAIASVTVCLTMRYPTLAVYLHAYFFEVCPYLVPLDLKPHAGETDEHFNRRLGFNYDGGKKEEIDKFLKRMSGVAQLYAAMLIANKRMCDTSLFVPLGVSELWMWITNFISLDPLSDISATLLLDVLEVAGHFMLTKYHFNFQKLLYIICTDYLEKIHKVTTKGRGGPVERLKTFLEDVIKVKRIPPPKGLLPSHFW